MTYAKVIFCLFLVLLALVLVGSRVNPERAFAMWLLIITCACQILFGSAGKERRRHGNEVLEFHPQGRKQ